ncbi:hypothetical protein ACROYT_G004903 [Oculina patagonica]
MRVCKNEQLYTISQQEVLRIERILKGGVDSDIDSEDEASDASDDEQPEGPSRVPCLQYATSLYSYIKVWRKNPRWSFSCCLGLLLPLNDLQGEIRGFEGENILSDQLQTGQIDEPELQLEVKNSGAIDVLREEGEESENNMTLIQKCSHTTCHQETQTELCLFSVLNFAVRKPTTELHEQSL